MDSKGNLFGYGSSIYPPIFENEPPPFNEEVSTNDDWFNFDSTHATSQENIEELNDWNSNKFDNEFDDKIVICDNAMLTIIKTKEDSMHNDWCDFNSSTIKSHESIEGFSGGKSNLFDNEFDDKTFSCDNSMPIEQCLVENDKNVEFVFNNVNNTSNIYFDQPVNNFQLKKEGVVISSEILPSSDVKHELSTYPDNIELYSHLCYDNVTTEYKSAFNTESSLNKIIESNTTVETVPNKNQELIESNSIDKKSIVNTLQDESSKSDTNLEGPWDPVFTTFSSSNNLNSTEEFQNCSDSHSVPVSDKLNDIYKIEITKRDSKHFKDNLNKSYNNTHVLTEDDDLAISHSNGDFATVNIITLDVYNKELDTGDAINDATTMDEALKYHIIEKNQLNNWNPGQISDLCDFGKFDGGSLDTFQSEETDLSSFEILKISKESVIPNQLEKKVSVMMQPESSELFDFENFDGGSLGTFQSEETDLSSLKNLKKSKESGIPNQLEKNVSVMRQLESSEFCDFGNFDGGSINTFQSEETDLSSFENLKKSKESVMQNQLEKNVPLIAQPESSEFCDFGNFDGGSLDTFQSEETDLSNFENLKKLTKSSIPNQLEKNVSVMIQPESSEFCDFRNFDGGNLDTFQSKETDLSIFENFKKSKESVVPYQIEKNVSVMVEPEFSEFGDFGNFDKENFDTFQSRENHFSSSANFSKSKESVIPNQLEKNVSLMTKPESSEFCDFENFGEGNLDAFQSKEKDLSSFENLIKSKESVVPGQFCDFGNFDDRNFDSTQFLDSSDLKVQKTKMDKQDSIKVQSEFSNFSAFENSINNLNEQTKLADSSDKSFFHPMFNVSDGDKHLDFEKHNKKDAILYSRASKVFHECFSAMETTPKRLYELYCHLENILPENESNLWSELQLSGEDAERWLVQYHLSEHFKKQILSFNITFQPWTGDERVKKFFEKSVSPSSSIGSFDILIPEQVCLPVSKNTLLAKSQEKKSFNENIALSKSILDNISGPPSETTSLDLDFFVSSTAIGGELNCTVSPVLDLFGIELSEKTEKVGFNSEKIESRSSKELTKLNLKKNDILEEDKNNFTLKKFKEPAEKTVYTADSSFSSFDRKNLNKEDFSPDFEEKKDSLVTNFNQKIIIELSKEQVENDFKSPDFNTDYFIKDKDKSHDNGATFEKHDNSSAVFVKLHNNMAVFEKLPDNRGVFEKLHDNSASFEKHQLSNEIKNMGIEFRDFDVSQTFYNFEEFSDFTENGKDEKGCSSSKDIESYKTLSFNNTENNFQIFNEAKKFQKQRNNSFEAFNDTNYLDFKAFNDSENFKGFNDTYDNTNDTYFQNFNNTKNIDFKTFTDPKDINFQAFNDTSNLDFKPSNGAETIEFKAFNDTDDNTAQIDFQNFNNTKNIDFQTFTDPKDINFQAFNDTRNLDFKPSNDTEIIEFKKFSDNNDNTNQIDFQNFNSTKNIDFQTLTETKNINFQAFNDTSNLDFKAFNDTENIDFKTFSGIGDNTNEIDFETFNSTKNIDLQTFTDTNKVNFQSFNDTNNWDFKAFNDTNDKANDFNFQLFNNTQKIDFQTFYDNGNNKFKKFTDTKIDNDADTFSLSSNDGFASHWDRSRSEKLNQITQNQNFLSSVQSSNTIKKYDTNIDTEMKPDVLPFSFSGLTKHSNRSSNLKELFPDFSKNKISYNEEGLTETIRKTIESSLHNTTIESASVVSSTSVMAMQDSLGKLKKLNSLTDKSEQLYGSPFSGSECPDFFSDPVQSNFFSDPTNSNLNTNSSSPENSNVLSVLCHAPLLHSNASSVLDTVVTMTPPLNSVQPIGFFDSKQANKQPQESSKVKTSPMQNTFIQTKVNTTNVSTFSIDPVQSFADNIVQSCDKSLQTVVSLCTENPSLNTFCSNNSFVHEYSQHLPNVPGFSSPLFSVLSEANRHSSVMFPATETIDKYTILKSLDGSENFSDFSFEKTKTNENMKEQNLNNPSIFSKEKMCQTVVQPGYFSSTQNTSTVLSSDLNKKIELNEEFGDFVESKLITSNDNFNYLQSECPSPQTQCVPQTQPYTLNPNHPQLNLLHPNDTQYIFPQLHQFQNRDVLSNKDNQLEYYSLHNQDNQLNTQYSAFLNTQHSAMHNAQHIPLQNTHYFQSKNAQHYSLQNTQYSVSQNTQYSAPQNTHYSVSQNNQNFSLQTANNDQNFQRFSQVHLQPVSNQFEYYDRLQNQDSLDRLHISTLNTQHFSAKNSISQSFQYPHPNSIQFQHLGKLPKQDNQYQYHYGFNNQENQFQHNDRFNQNNQFQYSDRSHGQNNQCIDGLHNPNLYQNIEGIKNQNNQFQNSEGLHNHKNVYPTNQNIQQPRKSIKTYSSSNDPFSAFSMENSAKQLSLPVANKTKNENAKVKLKDIPSSSSTSSKK